MKKIGLFVLFLLGMTIWQSCKKDDVPELPPGVVKIIVENETTVKVIFDKALESSSASAVSNYSLDNGYGNPQKAVAEGKEIILTFGSKLKAYNYTLSLKNIRSTTGTPIIRDYNVYFKF